MAAYKFYNPAPVFFTLLGTQPLAGGTMQFYDQGTTTPKNTWSNEGLSVLNPNPITLDASGRTSVDVFLDGDYTVVCKDSLGATIWTRDIISGAVAGQTIPALVAGSFLTNDGSNTLWAVIRQLPDATGSTGQVPVTNGGGPAGYTLQNMPVAPPAPTLDVVVGASSVRVGDGSSTTKYLQQRGTDSAPATGSATTSRTVTFSTPFSATPTLSLIPTSHSQPGGPVVAELTALSATGFTVLFDVAEGSGANPNIVNPVPFCWTANGNVVVP